MRRAGSLRYGEADRNAAIQHEPTNKPSDIPEFALSGTLSRTMRGEVQRYEGDLRVFRGYDTRWSGGIRTCNFMRHFTDMILYLTPIRLKIDVCKNKYTSVLA